MSLNDDEFEQALAKKLKATTHRESILSYIIEDLSVMSDFEIHKMCDESEAVHSFRLDQSHILESGKFNKLDVLLDELKQKGSRVLIFSQFVLILNIIQDFMKIRKHEFRRLDGQTQVRTNRFT